VTGTTQRKVQKIIINVSKSVIKDGENRGEEIIKENFSCSSSSSSSKKSATHEVLHHQKMRKDGMKKKISNVAFGKLHYISQHETHNNNQVNGLVRKKECCTMNES
jgi:hypothetical protein